MGLGEKAAKVTYRAAWSAWAAARPVPEVQVLHRAGIAPDGGDREFVHRIAETAYIEPQFGYVITERGHWIEQSLTPNFIYEVPAPWRIATPAPWRLLRARLGGARIREYDCVISLRHLWEWNYYHFYLDALGKLELLNDLGIDPDIPIVLGKYAHELPFVKQVINRGALGKRNWVLPDTEYVRARSVIYCRTGRPYRDRLNYLLRQMDVPLAPDWQNERYFLTRGPGGTRRILNEEAMLEVLAEFGFTTINTSGMTIDQQIELFSSARYLVASHGAGIANIFYRGDRPMSVLELHGRGHISQDFWRICVEYDHWWDHLAGDADGPDCKHANFTIPLDLLRAKLTAMFQQEDCANEVRRVPERQSVGAAAR